jgi:hypothetical protein
VHLQVDIARQLQVSLLLGVEPIHARLEYLVARLAYLWHLPCGHRVILLPAARRHFAPIGRVIVNELIHLVKHAV